MSSLINSLKSEIARVARKEMKDELLALRMGGSSFARLCAPVLALASLCTAACFWINLDLAPRAHAFADLHDLEAKVTKAMALDQCAARSKGVKRSMRRRDVSFAACPSGPLVK